MSPSKIFAKTLSGSYSATGPPPARAVRAARDRPPPARRGRHACDLHASLGRARAKRRRGRTNPAMIASNTEIKMDGLWPCSAPGGPRRASGPSNNDSGFVFFFPAEDNEEESTATRTPATRLPPKREAIQSQSDRDLLRPRIEAIRTSHVWEQEPWKGDDDDDEEDETRTRRRRKEPRRQDPWVEGPIEGEGWGYNATEDGYKSPQPWGGLLRHHRWTSLKPRRRNSSAGRAHSGMPKVCLPVVMVILLPFSA
ncbi:unnamed protein product, partial [Prorocentrum cordatum]